MLPRVLKGSALSVVGLALVIALEYTYIVLAGRTLDAGAFGVLSTVLAILTIVQGIGTAGLGQTVARHIACGGSGSSAATEWVSTVSVLQAAVGLLFGMGLLVASVLAAADPRFEDLSASMRLVAWVMPLLVMGTYLPYIDLGRSDVFGFNSMAVLGPAARVTMVLMLIAAGTQMSPTTFIGAFGVGAAAVILARVRRLKLIFAWASIEPRVVMNALRFALPVTVSSGLASLFLRADVVFLKLWLPGDPNAEIARYTVPAVLARLLFYFATAVSTALLPVVSTAERFPSLTVRRAMMILIAGLVILTGIAAVAGENFARMIFPVTLLGSIRLLVPLSLAMSLIGVAYVMSIVLIGAGRPGRGAVAFGVGFVVYTLVSAVTLRGWSVSPIGSFPSWGASGVAWASIIAGLVAVALQLPEFLRLGANRDRGVGRA